MIELNEEQRKVIQQAIVNADSFDPNAMYGKHELEILNYCNTIKTLTTIGTYYEKNIKLLAEGYQELGEYKKKYEHLLELIDLKQKKPRVRRTKKAVTTQEEKNDTESIESSGTNDDGERVQEDAEVEQQQVGIPIEEYQEAGGI